MKTKVQIISVSTLFAASIGCFLQFAIGVFVIISPFLLINIVAPISGQEAAKNYLTYMTPFTKNPILFTIGLVFLFICALLFLFASKKIRKSGKIQMWSMISLFSSFLLFYFGSGLMEISGFLGLIGSVTGLMHKEETKN